MKVSTPKLGGICQSLQGRDKGCYYVIVRLGEGEVYVADGKYKLIASPKKKNPKHIRLLPKFVALIEERASEGKPVYDNEIKFAIARAVDETIGG